MKRKHECLLRKSANAVQCNLELLAILPETVERQFQEGFDAGAQGAIGLLEPGVNFGLAPGRFGRILHAPMSYAAPGRDRPGRFHLLRCRTP